MNWITYSIISTLLYGLWGVLSKMASNHTGYASIFIYDSLAFFVGGLIAFAFNDFRIESNIKGITYSILYGVSGMIATLFFIIAVSKGQVSLVTTITAVYPCVTIILSIVILKESITIKQFIGIIFSIFGVILITV